MLCPMKVNSNIIKLTVRNSCYCVLDLLCVTGPAALHVKIPNSLNL